MTESVSTRQANVLERLEELERATGELRATLQALANQIENALGHVRGRLADLEQVVGLPAQDDSPPLVLEPIPAPSVLPYRPGSAIA